MKWVNELGNGIGPRGVFQKSTNVRVHSQRETSLVKMDKCYPDDYF